MGARGMIGKRKTGDTGQSSVTGVLRVSSWPYSSATLPQLTNQRNKEWWIANKDFFNVALSEKKIKGVPVTPKFRFRILTQGLSLNRGQGLWITEQFLSPFVPVHLQFIIPVSSTRWGLPGSSSGCHQASTLSFSQQETPGEICFRSLIAKQMGCNVPLNIFISAGVGSKGKLGGTEDGWEGTICNLLVREASERFSNNCGDSWGST